MAVRHSYTGRYFKNPCLSSYIPCGRNLGIKLFLKVHCCCCCCSVASVVSNSVRPHRRQPTSLLCPWDSPGKNSVMGCHFLLQRMKLKSESEVAQSCPTLRNPIDCSLSGSSIHGSFQARVLESGAIAFSVKFTRRSQCVAKVGSQPWEHIGFIVLY